MQDVLGVVHSAPDKVKERLRTLMGIQKSDGNARTLYFPGTGESMGGGRSDDHIWTVFSVCTYVKETGDYGFLEELIPFIDGGEGTVLQHLKLGLEFTKHHLGEHGVPLFLGSDWNDSLSKISWDKHKAESAFVFFQAAHAAYELIHLFEHLKDTENTQWAKQYYEWCRSVEPVLWDGKWYLRGFTDYGEKYGTDDDEYNKIFLNPQSWAVLSRLPSAEKGNSCFENVKQYLFCDLGTFIGYDQGHLSFVNTIHDSVHYHCHQISNDYTVDQAVHILEYQYCSKDDRADIKNKCNDSKCNVWFYFLDRYADEVLSAC